MTDEILRIRLTTDGEGKVHASLVDVANDVDQVDRSSKRATDSTTGLTRAVKALAAAASVRWALHTMVDMERLHAMLRTVTGSTEAATDAWNTLNQLSANTPYQLSQITKGYISLKSFGIDPLNGSMQAIIDQSSALGASQETLQGIILAVGQAWGKQKLEGQEILQLINQGVPVWGLLEKALHKNSAELQQMSQKGELGRDAITALVNEMGKLNAGAAAQQMNTLGGAFSNLADQATRDMDALDQSGLGHVLTDLVHGLTEVITPGTHLNEVLRETLPIVTGLLVANKLGPIFSSLSTRVLGFATSMATAAGRAVALNGVMAMLGGPVGILIGAATALGVWMATSDQAEEKTSDLVDRIDRALGKYKDLSARANQADLEAADKKITELQQRIAGINEAANMYSGEIGQTEELQKQLDVLIEKRKELQALVDKQAKGGGKKGGGAGDSSGDPALAQIYEREAAAEKKHREDIANSLQSEADLYQESYDKRMSALNDLNETGYLSDKAYTERSKRLYTQYQDQLTQLARQGNISREQFAQLSFKSQLKGFFGFMQDMSASSASTNKEMFEVNKIASSANAIINTYESVTKAMTAYPPPFNFAAAAAAMAAGMAQVQAIQSAQFGSSTSAPSISGGSATPTTPASDQSQVPATPAGPAAMAVASHRTTLQMIFRGNHMYSGEQITDQLLSGLQDAKRQGFTIDDIEAIME